MRLDLAECPTCLGASRAHLSERHGVSRVGSSMRSSSPLNKSALWAATEWRIEAVGKAAGRPLQSRSIASLPIRWPQKRRPSPRSDRFEPRATPAKDYAWRKVFLGRHRREASRPVQRRSRALKQISARALNGREPLPRHVVYRVGPIRSTAASPRVRTNATATNGRKYRATSIPAHNQHPKRTFSLVDNMPPVNTPVDTIDPTYVGNYAERVSRVSYAAT